MYVCVSGEGGQRLITRGGEGPSGEQERGNQTVTSIKSRRGVYDLRSFDAVLGIGLADTKYLR